jgi:hypothetical protein
MTALVPATVSRTGGGGRLDTAGAAWAVSTAADTFPAGPNTYLGVRNTTGGTVTVTVTPPAGQDDAGTTDGPLALAPVVEITTGFRLYGPFPQIPFADANGNVNFACAANGAGITVAAFIFPGG